MNSDSKSAVVEATPPLTGRVALVTGSQRGIGASIVRRLHRDGAAVVVTWYSPNGSEDADSLISELRTIDGDRVHGVELDVKDGSSIDSALASTLSRFDRVDILVNNAGINTPMPSLEVEEALWDDIVDTNLKGTFLCAQRVGRVMVEQGSDDVGHPPYSIVNIASQIGLVALPRRAAYCSAKAGVINLTRVLAVEWAEHGIRVNAVAPTVIVTDFTSELLEQPEYRNELLPKIPLGFMGEPEDVAAGVAYLCSPDARLVTGHTLVIDGGWTAQ
jgi:2-deoxy-D-gluconate 3-dehydrogenase